MTFPKKNSRTIKVNDQSFRWLTSKKNGLINLSIQSSEIAGQILLVKFEPHDFYKKDEENIWQKSFQSTVITPKTVRKFILLGLANDWAPHLINHKLFELNLWQMDRDFPEIIGLDGEVRLRDLAESVLEDLRFELSIDPAWRKKLFEADVGSRFQVPNEYLSNMKDCEKYNLKFYVFNDGRMPDGYAVFGFECPKFPNLIRYSSNRFSDNTDDQTKS